MPRSLATTARGRIVWFALVSATAWLFDPATAAVAATIHVDSLLGDDRLDGATAEQVSDRSGPVRTLRRGIQLARFGDRLVLANRGVPYEGGASLVGLQQSGSAAIPLEIIGNGAIVSGARPIDPSTWRMQHDDIWRVTPSRKGWFQLILNGEAVAEIPCPPDAPELPPLPEGAWCAYQGAVYYRPPFGKIPADLPLHLADEQTGLTLLDVRHVIIRDLTFQHFRQDGLHLHDRCHTVLLENVVCRQNGRCGVIIRGTGDVYLRNVTLKGNRGESLLVQGLAVAQVEGGEFDREPTVQSISRSAASGR